MNIYDADKEGKVSWNQFVQAHYPPVGAFMQTWEWGEFQKTLGRTVRRYYVGIKHKPAAAFTLVEYKLPGGFAYGYAPRGPVIARTADTATVFEAIERWARTACPQFIFLRFEPPVRAVPHSVRERGFVVPLYYIQPRFNATLSLVESEDDILARFHPTTRSNIKRAQKRGVSTEQKFTIEERDFDEFFAMAADTTKRSGEKNVYPSRAYFHSLVNSVPAIGSAPRGDNLSIGLWYGFQDGKPAAIHFVLYFGETATYLFGAAYTERLRSKVTTYLHWMIARDAKKQGYRFYDIGGIDKNRWPTLTEFKQQFGGKEFSYVGNFDLPLRPLLYRAYNLARRFTKN